MILKSISFNRWLLVFITVSVIITPCYAGQFFIFDEKILGCHKDSALSTEINTQALRKIDSIKVADTRDNPSSYPEWQKPSTKPDISIYPPRFKQYPIINEKWAFAEDTCLKMYSVYAGFSLYDAPRDVFEIALYNQCDSSIYHFGGDINAFSRVVKDYLNNNFHPPHIIELLRLYINSFTDESRVYILQSSDYVDSLFNFHIHEFLGDSKDDYAQTRRKDLDNDRENVKKLINNINVNTFPDSMTLEFYTWNYSSGSLDKWKFRATKESLDLEERSSIAKNIGPHIPLGSD